MQDYLKVIENIQCRSYGGVFFLTDSILFFLLSDHLVQVYCTNYIVINYAV